MRADRDGAVRAGEERVTVRRRGGHERGADDAARACAVVDDDLLSELVRQSPGERAHDDIGRAAGRLSDDEADGTFGIRIARRRGGMHICDCRGE
jgi:hypothetical protein